MNKTPLNNFIKNTSSKSLDFKVAHALNEYLHNNKIPFKANDNISKALKDLNISKADLIDDVELAFSQVLYALGIDYKNDHNSQDTPRRYAKMTINETFSGRYDDRPSITAFPNASNLDQVILIRDISVESVCSHHHQNIRGKCHIAVLPDPNGKVLGLSKYARIVRHFARRPQIQEELTTQIANEINYLLSPRGVAVIIDASHQCMLCRGVNEHDSTTLTSYLLGEFRNSSELRQELMSLLRRTF